MEKSPKEVGDLAPRLEASLGRLLEWIAAADGKTATVFAVGTALLGVLVALSPSPREWTRSYAAAAIAAGLLQGLSILFASFATFPRTAGPADSLVYFGGIAPREFDTYLGALRRQSADAYIEDLARQCHRNAEIARSKFIWVKRGLAALYLSAVPWLVALYLLYDREVSSG
ncbi:MAG: DUF5706 domain-containing protein [Thermoanaerobaculia bacterium]|nr:DUF5706 domain-containing protein [Thermoanaerobaculia bacterium]